MWKKFYMSSFFYTSFNGLQILEKGIDMDDISFAKIVRIVGWSLIMFALGENQVLPWSEYWKPLTILYLTGALILSIGVYMNEDWRP